MGTVYTDYDWITLLLDRDLQIGTLCLQIGTYRSGRTHSNARTHSSARTHSHARIRAHAFARTHSLSTCPACGMQHAAAQQCACKEHAVCVLEVDDELCLLALRFVEGADQCVDERSEKPTEEAAVVVHLPRVEEADDAEESQLRSCQ